MDVITQAVIYTCVLPKVILEIPEKAESLDYHKMCSCDCCNGVFPVETMEVVYAIRAKDRNILEVYDLCLWCFSKQYQYSILIGHLEKLP